VINDENAISMNELAKNYILNKQLIFFQVMTLVSSVSFIAYTSASIVGVVTTGVVTMKYIFRSYPKFSSSKIAAFPVAALKGCRVKSKHKNDFSVQFQIFYPCVDKSNGERASKNTQTPTYMRPNALEGLCKSLGNSKIVKYILKNILLNKPASHLKDGLAEDIEPLMCSKLNDTKVNKNEKSWPVVIFSHGLFGSLELYSTICCEIASQGFVVVALEHEDGSASYAQQVSPEAGVKFSENQSSFKDENDISSQEAYLPIPYKKPTGVTYSEKSSVVNFRKPFLNKRYEEVCDLIDGLVEFASSPNIVTTSSDSNTNDVVFKAKKCLLDVMRTTSLADDQDKSVILAGHSFGGATMQFMMYQLINETTKKITSDIKIKSLILLDTWVSPVPDEVLSQKYSRIPTLSIFCETFVTWTPTKESHELTGVEKMLQANKRSKVEEDMFKCVAIRGTRHQFFSDVPYWVPKILGNYGKVSGETDISISRSCLEKLIGKFLLKDEAPLIMELTEEESEYVYDVDEKMLNAPI